MHTLSCFYLLHHHFQAVDDTFDIVSLSSNSVNDDSASMSDYSDDHESDSNVDMNTDPADDVDPSGGATINPDDDENLFVFDESSRSLICVGSTFNEIPQTIIDRYAAKAKVWPLRERRNLALLIAPVSLGDGRQSQSLSFTRFDRLFY